MAVSIYVFLNLINCLAVNLELFDIYEGERIEADKKSMAYSITFRNKEKTLEEAEITAVMGNILKGLEHIGAVLRS